MGLRDFFQHTARLAARRGEIVVAERRIGDDRDAVPLAPRDQRVFDGPLLQMIKYLIAGDAALTGYIKQFVEVVHVEIADAPGADLAGANQFVERRDRLG